MTKRYVLAMAVVALLALTAGCVADTTGTNEEPTESSDPVVTTDVVECDDPESECRVTFTVESLGDADSIVLEDYDSATQLREGDSHTLDTVGNSVMVLAEEDELYRMVDLYVSPTDIAVDDESDVPRTPTAGVDVTQTGTDVAVTLISLDNADEVAVTSSSCGEGTLESVGERVMLEDCETGDNITILAELDGNKAVIQVYEVD